MVNFPENKTTGKAVADIKGLYFLKHGAAEPVILESLESPDWFSVLTLRGTVNASQDAPSLEKILVDQFDTPIGITSEPGDFSFEAQLPSFATADLARIFGEGGVDIAVDQAGEPILINGKQVVGLKLDGTLYDASVMVQTRTNHAIIFSRVEFSLTFSKEDKVFILRCSGQVLSPENEKNLPVYVACFAPEAAVLSYDANGGTGTIASVNSYVGKSVAAATCTMTKASNTFAGWNTAADGSGKSYAAGDSVVLYKDTKLYAQWVSAAA